MKLGSLAEEDRLFRTVRNGEPRRGDLIRLREIDDDHAPSIGVGVEHRWSQPVATSVAVASVRIDGDPHASPPR